MSPLSLSLTQQFRKNELVLGSGWRALFAPFNIAYNAGQKSSQFGPAVVDLQFQGPFNLSSPPAGWYDLGWIKDFKMTPGSKIGQIKSGYRGATRQQVRGEIGEQFEFKFREFTRMAYKISTGSEIFNLLKTNQVQTTGPLNASGFINASFNAVPLGASGYQVTGGSMTGTYAGQPTLFVPTTSGSLFAVNDLLVCDVDYDKVSTGFIGSNGIPVYVNNAPQDVDFIRKTSDFVGRIIAVVPSAPGVAGSQDALVLSQPIVGGGSSGTSLVGPTGPVQSAKIQKIDGWTSREGGTFITEWSALFIMDTVDGDQLVQYYPHVSISQFKDVANWAITNIGTTDLTGYELDCTMEALAYDDPVDGETVVCYRAFYPGSGQDISI
jgi:hypothetical protein